MFALVEVVCAGQGLGPPRDQALRAGVFWIAQLCCSACVLYCSHIFCESILRLYNLMNVACYD